MHILKFHLALSSLWPYILGFDPSSCKNVNYEYWTWQQTAQFVTLHENVLWKLDVSGSEHSAILKTMFSIKKSLNYYDQY